MNILVIDNNTSYMGEIKSVLKKHNLKVAHYTKLYRVNPSDFDLLILTGGKGRAIRYNRLHFRAERKLIKKTKTPIIGICLGAEMVADVFGGHVSKMPVGRRHYCEIQFVKESGLMPAHNPIKVYEAHRWSIDKLPEETLETIAASSDGVEIFKHKNRSIYGLQFHPEVVRKYDHGAIILKRVIKNLTKSSVKSKKPVASKNSQFSFGRS